MLILKLPVSIFYSVPLYRLAEFAIGVVGCTTTVASAVPDLTVVSDLPPKAVIIERVTATLCVERAFGMPPSDAEALDELKRVAAQKPISGLYKVKYSPEGLISRCGIPGGKRATALTYRIEP